MTLTNSSSNVRTHVLLKLANFSLLMYSLTLISSSYALYSCYSWPWLIHLLDMDMYSLTLISSSYALYTCYSWPWPIPLLDMDMYSLTLISSSYALYTCYSWPWPIHLLDMDMYHLILTSSSNVLYSCTDPDQFINWLCPNVQQMTETSLFGLIRIRPADLGKDSCLASNRQRLIWIISASQCYVD